MLKPNVDKPAAKPGPKSDANDDLKSLPMPDVEKKLGSSPEGLGPSRSGRETAGPVRA